MGSEAWKNNTNRACVFSEGSINRSVEEIDRHQQKKKNISFNFPGVVGRAEG